MTSVTKCILMSPVSAFMQSKCVCPECVCRHPWPAFPLGGILCTDIHPCWNRADLGL